MTENKLRYKNHPDHGFGKNKSLQLQETETSFLI